MFGGFLSKVITWCSIAMIATLLATACVHQNQNANQGRTEANIHEDIITAYDFLMRNEYASGSELLQERLLFWESRLGADHVEIADILGETVLFLRHQDRDAEAEALLRRSLQIREKSLGPNDPSIANALNELSIVLDRQERYEDAELLRRRARAIWEQQTDLDSTLRTLIELESERETYIYGKKDLSLSALSFLVIAPRIGKQNADSTREAVALFASSNYERRQGRASDAAATHERAVRKLQSAEASSADFATVGWQAVVDAWPNAQYDSSYTDVAFQRAQFVSDRSVSVVVSEAMARRAAETTTLATAVRKREQLIHHRDILTHRLINISEFTNKIAEESSLPSELLLVIDQINRVDAFLSDRFPAYVQLTDPQPTPVAEVGDLLSPDEALLYYLIEPNRGAFLWVIRPDFTRWQLLHLAPTELASRVARLRAALDPAQGGGVGEPFPRADAAALRRDLLPDESTMLAGVRHLIIVPDGPLESLPFALLVGGNQELSSHDWLVERYATTTLPAVSSLVALRRLERGGGGTAPFAGIGDPVLKGGGTARGVAASSLVGTRGLGDPAKLRALPALPATGPELQRLAATLGSGPDRLHLRDAATEANVKAGVLADSRVVAFATHAAIAGELEGLAEPALVLTPPATATELDDGLLTASEAAQLRLNADLVLLSACNTAAPDGKPSAEGLSGLAKAFFYAGTRALLVSHWAIYDKAAPELTTGMIEALAAEPGIGLAEALRRSQLAMINGTHPHPSEWAPFVVVGEGGAGRGVLELGGLGG